MSARQAILAHDHYRSGAPFTAQEMADMIGFSSRTVAAALTHMRTHYEIVHDGNTWHRHVPHPVHQRRLADTDWLNDDAR